MLCELVQYAIYKLELKLPMEDSNALLIQNTNNGPIRWNYMDHPKIALYIFLYTYIILAGVVDI